MESTGDRISVMSLKQTPLQFLSYELNETLQKWWSFQLRISLVEWNLRDVILQNISERMSSFILFSDNPLKLLTIFAKNLVLDVS